MTKKMQKLWEKGFELQSQIKALKAEEAKVRAELVAYLESKKLFIKSSGVEVSGGKYSVKERANKSVDKLALMDKVGDDITLLKLLGHIASYKPKDVEKIGLPGAVVENDPTLILELKGDTNGK